MSLLQEAMRRKRQEQMEQKNKIISSIATPLTTQKSSIGSSRVYQTGDSLYGSAGITNHSSSSSSYSFTPSQSSPIRVKREGHTDTHMFDVDPSNQEEQLRRRHQYPRAPSNPDQQTNQMSDNQLNNDDEDVCDPKPSASGHSGLSVNMVFFIILLISALVLFGICVYSVAIVCLS